MKKLITWLKTNKRAKYLIYGTLLYLILLALVILKIPEVFILALTIVLIMASMEYKDKSYNNTWDWKDIITGSIIPIILSLILCLIL